MAGLRVSPLLFLVALGVWRNVCPLAASDQLTRALNITHLFTLTQSTLAIRT